MSNISWDHLESYQNEWCSSFWIKHLDCLEILHPPAYRFQIRWVPQAYDLYILFTSSSLKRFIEKRNHIVSQLGIPWKKDSKITHQVNHKWHVPFKDILYSITRGLSTNSPTSPQNWWLTPRMVHFAQGSTSCWFEVSIASYGTHFLNTYYLTFDQINVNGWRTLLNLVVSNRE